MQSRRVVLVRAGAHVLNQGVGLGHTGALGGSQVVQVEAQVANLAAQLKNGARLASGEAAGTVKRARLTRGIYCAAGWAYLIGSLGPVLLLDVLVNVAARGEAGLRGRRACQAAGR